MPLAGDARMERGPLGYRYGLVDSQDRSRSGLQESWVLNLRAS